MSDQKAPWGVYNPAEKLVYTGMHVGSIEAWLGYFGGVVPYGAILEKKNAGWSAKRIEDEATNVVPLRPYQPAVLGTPEEVDGA